MHDLNPSIPKPARPEPAAISSLFGSLSDDFWYWCLTEGFRTEAWLRELLPSLPAEDIQRKYTGQAGEATLKQAFGFYQLCKQAFASRGLTLAPENQLLDFGCGWGRITRFWLKDVQPGNLLGVDVTQEAVNLCRNAHFPSRFARIHPLPPLNLPDASLDAIVSYSIFSHLPEKYFLAWMDEFRRLLRPGGVLVITTRPREAVMEFKKSRESGEVPEHALGSAKAFQDEDTVLRAYDAGAFCYDGLGGDPNIPGQYGEAMIPLAYIRKACGEKFAAIDMIDFKTHYFFDQNCIVMQKPALRKAAAAETQPAGPGPDAEPEELPWTGERLVPSLQGEIAVEHLHRYAVAAQLARGQVVLDLACGEGYGSALLAREAKQVTGVDISPEAIAHAQRKYARPNLEFRVGRAEAIPLADASVDVVVSFETIEHIQDPEAFLAEIKRCLKADGVLVISSPDKPVFDAVNPEPNPYHVHELAHAELIELLRKQYKNMVMAKQKIVQGSYLAADQADARVENGTFTGDFETTDFQPGVRQGVYSFAVCSDVDLRLVPLGVFETDALYLIPSQAPARALEGQAAERGLELRSRLLGLLQQRLLDSQAHGEALEKEVAGLQLQLRASQEKNLTLESALEATQAHNRALESALESTRQELKAAQERHYALQADLSQAQQHLQANLAHSRALESTLAQERREFEKTASALSQTKNQAQVLEQALGHAHQRLDWLRELMRRGMQQLQAARFAATRLQHIPRAVRQTLARKLNSWLGQAAFWRTWRSRPAVAAMIRESGLFDEAFYLSQYPAQAAGLNDPIGHYLRQGAGEHKRPNPYFDGDDYLRRNPDAALSGMNPLVHFLRYGEAEGRDPGPEFDSLFYMEQYPDVIQAGIAPFRHFWLYGRQEGRLPKAVAGAESPQTYPDAGPSPTTGEVPVRKRDSLRRPVHERPQPLAADPLRPRLIAFYLPQYHPIPENDAWWGPGFTEWEYVAQARPLFSGHYQPHLPADLGFYDLRVPEVREQQAALARAYGIHGFCYYYYWFNGRRLLEQPLQEVVAAGEPDFPFCVCWANENWTRNWDGQDQDVLISQEHTLESDLDFIHELLPLFRDPRYIRYQGRPVLLVYRTDRMHDPKRTARAWREACVQAGLPGLHLCAVETVGFGDPRDRGFDALVEFPPNHFATQNIAATVPGLDPGFAGHIADYREIMEYSLRRPEPAFTYHRGVMTCWDNTPRRRERGLVFYKATPERYQLWLEGLINKPGVGNDPEAMLFVNAWNEWGEGAHLEPDLEYGHAWLEATRRVLEKPAGQKQAGPAAVSTVAVESAPPENRPLAPEEPGPKRLGLVIHDGHCHGAQFIALTLARTLAEKMKYTLVIVSKQDGELLSEFAKYGKVIRLTDEIRQRGSEPAALEAIGRRLQSERIRSVICNTVVTGDLAAWLKPRGFNVLGLVHELPTLIQTYGYQTLAKQLAEAADVLAFPAEYVRKAFLEWHPLAPAKCRIRPQGILQPNRYREKREMARQKVAQKHGLGPNSKIVLNCAYADLRKGPDLFVALAQSVLRQLADVNVHFIWAGSLQPEFQAWLKHDLARTGLDRKVHFIGFQKDDALYLAAADVFALTSREDPFPNVVLSAMEVGVPVAAFTGSGGAAEMLAAGCGVVVPYLDIQAMSGEVCRLLRDPGSGRELVQAAMNKAAREYQFEQYAGNLLGDLGLMI
ncbi:MAG: glycoside hydrolase family 99-like domain-containing protein [candidate division FCPU426 bacterium]